MPQNAAMRLALSPVASTKPHLDIMVRWPGVGYDLNLGTVYKTGEERDLGDGERVQGYEYHIVSTAGDVKFFVPNPSIDSRDVEAAVFDLCHALLRAAGLEPTR